MSPDLEAVVAGLALHMDRRFEELRTLLASVPCPNCTREQEVSAVWKKLASEYAFRLEELSKRGTL